MKNIKHILETQEVEFQIKGITNHKNEPKIFKMSHFCGDLELHSVHTKNATQSMNVDRFGPTCMWLYNYSLLGKKIVEKIRYEDVTIMES